MYFYKKNFVNLVLVQSLLNIISVKHFHENFLNRYKITSPIEFDVLRISKSKLYSQKIIHKIYLFIFSINYKNKTNVPFIQRKNNTNTHLFHRFLFLHSTCYENHNSLHLYIICEYIEEYIHGISLPMNRFFSV